MAAPPISSDAEFPPAQPPAAAVRFKVTPPGGFPVDVYLSAWGEGYVIHAPGQAPIYLISDKKGGFVMQRPGDGGFLGVPAAGRQRLDHPLRQRTGHLPAQAGGGLPGFCSRPASCRP